MKIKRNNPHSATVESLRNKVEPVKVRVAKDRNSHKLRVNAIKRAKIAG